MAHHIGHIDGDLSQKGAFHFLGTLDIIFLLSYVVGLFVSGMVVFDGFLFIVICNPCILSCVQQMASNILYKIMLLQVQTVLA